MKLDTPRTNAITGRKQKRLDQALNKRTRSRHPKTSLQTKHLRRLLKKG